MPKVKVIENMSPRVMVADTDIGKELTKQVEELTELINAYRRGVIAEKHTEH